jgi:hypothetical protein
MARVRFRYKNGELDEWELNDQVDLAEFVGLLHRTMGDPAIASFGLAPGEGEPSVAYGFAGVRMSEVAAWSIEGLTDTSAEAALWAELQGYSPEGDVEDKG